MKNLANKIGMLKYKAKIGLILYSWVRVRVVK